MINFSLSEMDFIVKLARLAQSGILNTKHYAYLEGIIDFINSKKIEASETINDLIEYPKKGYRSYKLSEKQRQTIKFLLAKRIITTDELVKKYKIKRTAAHGRLRLLREKGIVGRKGEKGNKKLEYFLTDIGLRVAKKII